MRKDLANIALHRAVLRRLTGAGQLKYAAVDRQSCGDLGPKFYNEAVRWFTAEEESHDPHILLVPAAALLCTWCESVGDHQASTWFVAKALSIANQLELFSKPPREPHMCDAHRRRMIKAEAIVAWGFYMRQV